MIFVFNSKPLKCPLHYEPEFKVLVAGGDLQPVKHRQEHVGRRTHHLFKPFACTM